MRILLLLTAFPYTIRPPLIPVRENADCPLGHPRNAASITRRKPLPPRPSVT
ncbi:hypothetical protein WCP94_004409 [Bilophila wadsworthia]